MTEATTIIAADGEGERLWFYGGGVHVWKATSEQTNGAFIVFEDVLVRGKTTPLHRHPDHDEMIYIIEGEILVHADGVERRVGPGGTVVATRGAVHAFLVVSETARILCVQTPGSGEAFFRQASIPAPDGPDASGPVDIGRVADAARQTGVTELLGPPPFSPR